jgi:predicted nucleotidyltransferase
VHGRSRVFGSVARGEPAPGSDLDLLVDMPDGPSLFEQAALQHDLEKLLGCRVHVMTTGGVSVAREHVAERVKREAVSL